MKTISVQEPINLRVVRFELDFSALAPDPKHESSKKRKNIKIPKVENVRKCLPVPPPPPLPDTGSQKKDVKDLIEALLDELYADQRAWSSSSGVDYSHGSTSVTSTQSNCGEQTDSIERSYLESLDIDELRQQVDEWEYRLQVTGERLAKSVRARDRLKRQQKRICAAFTVLLRHITGETGARFGVGPSGGGEGPGEGGYAEWLHAMRLVARLPAGVPQHFRKKLWLTLAERHLTARGVEWSSAERACFRGTAQPDDTELGAQILKDLHRTGCSLFCGTEGRENQAMLRRVLLAYARWNKDVGYCQGFNMLAAIILEVMEKSESDSLKVMIYLVEAVLPEGYFADDLRGLSADMAAFRDLLRLRLPRLANHMDHLQRISDGGGVEPPLPDVFTMQWFLTLYATWLPRECLLRIWDLVLLDGNEVLLLTALAIWDMLQDRILSARSADEFYSCMGGGAGEVWAAGDSLVARVVAFGSAPELPRLRSLHRYRVAPPAPPSAPVYQPPLHSTMQSMTKRGLRLFYSEDEGDSSDDGNKLALATVMPRREDRLGAGDRLSLDIGALKRQYARLRERQRQAHVILAAACARHAAVGVPTSPTSLTVNNLLLGKNAIVSSRGRRLGPPPGAIPPSRLASSPRDKTESRSHSRSNETISWNEEKSRKSLSRRNSVKWKDIKKEKVKEKIRKASIDLEEAGDGVIVSELEANQMIASLRSRSSSETSSYSSRTASSTDTSLCDDKENASDSETDLPDDDKGKDNKIFKLIDKTTPSQKCKDKKGVQKSPDAEQVIFKHSPDQDTNILNKNPVKDITDYLDSAAGEPLRTYIDGFESKLKDNAINNPESSLYKPISPFKPLSPFKFKESIISSSENNVYKPTSPFKSISPFSTDRSEVLQKLNRMNFDEIPENNELFRPTKMSRVSKNFTDLSPVDLSPCNYSMDLTSPYDYEFESNFMHTSTAKSTVSTRHPDIIDSFTMYPNFVPDIDLSDKNVSDLESPPRSPDAESIIVSEDEPPIQLKIDKYFEHSPEFFGARVTDPNNSDIPNRRPVKRHSRLPKKPDSLTLHMSSTEKLLKHDVERASSLPQSHSFNNTATPSPKYISSTEQKETHILMSEQKVNTPEQKLKSPVRIVKTPEQNIQTPEQNIKTPEQNIKTPEQNIKTPEHNIKTPEHNIKTPGQNIKTPEQNIKTPAPKLESPEQKIKSPETNLKTPEQTKDRDIVSPKDYILRSGRKNSERALQIIQENSKILSRILTKQNMSESTNKITEANDAIEMESDISRKDMIPEKTVESKFIDSPLLKESTSDSLIGYRKRNFTSDTNEKNDFTRIRPISIDDPFSLEVRNLSLKNEDSNTKTVKIPSNECLGNKTDFYGWENKGFLAKCEFKTFVPKSDVNYDYEYKRKINENIEGEFLKSDVKPIPTSEWARHSFSGDSRTSITLPSSERKDSSTFDKRLTSDDYNYPFSSKYNDFVLSKASDICSKIVDKEPKVCENLSKTDNSQVSDFANVVTSSISFTYEPSVEDDSPMGGKSNSSDTLCQITSLDQVSTPISPKIFPRETPTLPKDIFERNDKTKVESDDTCSAITSLIETDTLSSLSYPRSPSTGSYHPFPTRPAMRMPKELGVRLGMYPKDTVSSPQK